MDRIPFYNLLNMLFVGFIGLVCGTFVAPYDLWSNWRFLQGLVNNTTIEVMLFVSFAYMIGLVINRMGSWIIEDVLKTETGYEDLPWIARKIKFPWRRYEAYVLAQRQDAGLKFLTREYVLSRNMVMLFLVLVIIAFIYAKYVCGLVYILAVILFNVSMRKYVYKIVKRIDACSQKRS